MKFKICRFCSVGDHGHCFHWFCDCPLEQCVNSRNTNSLIYELRHRGKQWTPKRDDNK